MSRLVKLVGSGIGLASEAIAARKAESSSSGPSSHSPGPSSHFPGPSNRQYPVDPSPPQYSETDPADQKSHHDDKHYPDDGTDEDSEANDEEDWDLDEAADEYSEPRGSMRGNQQQLDANGLAQSFLAEHPPSYSQATKGARLPFPVILPQRRPREKSRGFVRAYAPVLADCGIDQATFLHFLDTFYKASQASPVLNVINVAAVAVGFVPSVAAQITSNVVLVVAGVAKVIQTRSRTNTFLDQINEKLFKPHGLFCLIMSYKPDQKATSAPTDISQTITQSLSATPGYKQNLRLSSGKTHGELEMPEAAPLIYPALDAASDTQKQNAFKKSTGFIADYYDRRAQAKYAAQHPDNSLTVPQTQSFASRYSDPNHAASNGSPISLLTGGYINPKARRDERRSRRSDRRSGRRLVSRSPLREDDRFGAIGIRGRRAARSKGQPTGLRRALQQDVLYLMIANLPTEEEIHKAEKVLAEHA